MLLYYPEEPANARIYVESPLTFGLKFENEFITTKDNVSISLPHDIASPRMLMNICRLIWRLCICRLKLTCWSWSNLQEYQSNAPQLCFSMEMLEILVIGLSLLNCNPFYAVLSYPMHDFCRLLNAYAILEMCKVNFVLVEYRGFGKSHGRPSEQGKMAHFFASNSFLWECNYV